MTRRGEGPVLIAKHPGATWGRNKVRPEAQNKTPLNRAQRRGVAKLKRKAGDAKQ
jgi:hypothetical protein